MKNLIFLFAFLFLSAGVVFATDRIDKDDGTENVVYSDVEVNQEVISFEIQKAPDHVPIFVNVANMIVYADLQGKKVKTFADKPINKARDKLSCNLQIESTNRI
jgi:hypothetical protein